MPCPVPSLTLYHTIPWVCYRRRNLWLRLALAYHTIAAAAAAAAAWLDCWTDASHAVPGTPVPGAVIAGAAWLRGCLAAGETDKATCGDEKNPCDGATTGANPAANDPAAKYRAGVQTRSGAGAGVGDDGKSADTHTLVQNAQPTKPKKHTAAKKKKRNKKAGKKATLTVKPKRELKFDLQWFAPFLAGGGYASEGIAFVSALDSMAVKVKIFMHGDTPQEDFIDGLPKKLYQRLTQQAMAPPTDSDNAVVICHSEPGAWNARQSRNINQNGATLDSRCVLVGTPSTFGAGSQQSQPKHVSNPDSILKKCQRCVLVGTPSTFGAGSQRSQPKHVSNPDYVLKKC